MGVAIGGLQAAEWKPEGEHRARTRLALELHSAAVQLDDAPGQRQPQAGALDLAGGGAVHLVELVEDALVVLTGDPNAGVAHLDAQRLRALGSRLDPHSPALRR